MDATEQALPLVSICIVVRSVQGESMRSSRGYFIFGLLGAIFLIWILSSMTSYPQARTGAASGVVTDSTGALIPGATVNLTDSEGRLVTATCDGEGRYNFPRLAAGKYEMRVTAPGFSSAEGLRIEVGSSRSITRDVQLELAVVQQSVEVVSSSTIDTEPSSNASALTIKGDSLQSLSDDPDDLAQDLQLLAGPSTGPDGGEIYVDGFSGAKLPPKSAIREIRVNQNPFSAEYDRLGYGRIEILTKPGADKYHGDIRFNLGDSAFNSRNPFAPAKPDYQRRTFEGTVGGPVGSRASFNFQMERRDIGQASLINALVLDPSFNAVPYRASISDPRTDTEIGARLDYQLRPNHTLVARYEWEKNYQTNAGLDTFSMASRGYNLDEREHVIQVTESAMLGASAVNEVRFQYRRSQDANRAVSSAPAVQVLDAFISGGTSMSLDRLLENRYEIQESLLLSKGKHTLRIGGRLRAIQEDNASGNNYNGVFTFATLDAYRITEQAIAAGLTPAEIRSQGGGASQFSMGAGDPLARITQFDIGVFAQDDWRARNNLTLSYGLRYERQTNIDDWRSWAPRVGLAWGIPGGAPDKPVAVLRAGFGIFYDRIRENLVLDAMRLDGIHQQQYRIPNPDFYPAIPPADSLSAFVQDQAVRKLAPNLHAPGTAQFALSVERQLAKNTIASLGYMNSRGFDMLRSRNLNTPEPATGTRPYPGGNIYAYESNGRFRQNQIIANINARVSNQFSMFGYYTWSSARSDTDGPETFPSSTYDLAAEYSRAGFDVKHRAMIGASWGGPFGLYFNPFVFMHSGAPFNIITGQDLNGDSIFNDRPAWATDLSRASVVQTRWGAFDTLPLPGQAMIPRNLGTSPGMAAFNLRVSKAFGLGPRTGERIQSASSPPPPAGGPMRGHYHGSEAVASDHKFSLTLSAAARNLFNTVNLDTPVANLSSPLFGTSRSIHGFGPGGSSANRTIDLQVRLSF
jgi:hypothetical protein